MSRNLFLGTTGERHMKRISTGRTMTRMPNIHRHLQLEQSRSLDKCRPGMDLLYQNMDLKIAFDEYNRFEKSAFQKSCGETLSRNRPIMPYYDCDVQMNASVIDDFEMGCQSAGGTFIDFGVPIGMECCGEIDGTQVLYGYHTRDLRLCINTTACTEQDAASFYPQGMFEAGTQVFEGELGLTCGGGCDQRPLCIGETYQITAQEDLVLAKRNYYASMANAIREQCTIDEHRIHCFDIWIDPFTVHEYQRACDMAGGVLASSQSILEECPTSSHDNSVLIDLQGTFSCVSEYCDVEETEYLVSLDTEFSPTVTFATNQVFVCHEDDSHPPDRMKDNEQNSLSVGAIVGISLGILACFLISCYMAVFMNSVKQNKHTGNQKEIISNKPMDSSLLEISSIPNSNPSSDVAIAFPQEVESKNDPMMVPSKHTQSSVPDIEASKGVEEDVATYFEDESGPPVATSTRNGYERFSSNPPAVNPEFMSDPFMSTLNEPESELPSPIPVEREVVSLDRVVKEADSSNQVQEVEQWMQDYPAEAAALTPDDVTKVISNVSFLLQKTTVAEKLGVGIGHTGNLTCAHVVAAIRACSLQKEELVKSMAPLVNDPHNKDTVLNEFHFSFERDHVAKHFL